MRFEPHCSIYLIQGEFGGVFQPQSETSTKRCSAIYRFKLLCQTDVYVEHTEVCEIASIIRVGKNGCSKTILRMGNRVAHARPSCAKSDDTNSMGSTSPIAFR